MRVLVNYDRRTRLDGCPTFYDLDTGMGFGGFRLVFVYGEEPFVDPPSITEVWERRKGQERLIYKKGGVSGASHEKGTQGEAGHAEVLWQEAWSTSVLRE